MVRGLVRRWLLRALTGTESARAEERNAAGFAGRLVAASYQGYAGGGAFEYSSGVPIRGLRIPNRAVVGLENWRESCRRKCVRDTSKVRVVIGCRDVKWFSGVVPWSPHARARSGGSGSTRSKAKRSSGCARSKTGERAPEAPECRQYNNRGSRPEVCFLSQHCDQRGTAEQQAEVRTLCGRDRRPFAISQLRRGCGN